MTPEQLAEIKARAEVVPPYDLAIHYPQDRSKPHIVAVDQKGNIVWWIAVGFQKDDEAHNIFQLFAHAPADISALIAEIERLQDNDGGDTGKLTCSIAKGE
jgi:hypothetical protein